MSTLEILNELDALQIRYIRALDQRDWAAWLACFDSQSSYVCIPRENVENDLPLAIMLDDCYERLCDRVTFITEVWAGTYEDYTTRHFVQRLECTMCEPGLYAVQSNFMVTYTSPSGAADILVAGSYDDRVRLGHDGPRYVSKRAIVDTTTTPRYLVYPV